MPRKKFRARNGVPLLHAKITRGARAQAPRGRALRPPFARHSAALAARPSRCGCARRMMATFSMRLIQVDGDQGSRYDALCCCAQTAIEYIFRSWSTITHGVTHVIRVDDHLTNAALRFRFFRRWADAAQVRACAAITAKMAEASKRHGAQACTVSRHGLLRSDERLPNAARWVRGTRYPDEETLGRISQSASRKPRLGLTSRTRFCQRALSRLQRTTV